MKRIRVAFVVLLSAATTALVAASFTFSWLSGAVTEIEMNGVHGGIISQYFHCGTGTEEDPYVITRPIHLYNLTMLYENLDGFAEQNNHFQLGYNLDGNDGLEFYSYNDEGIYQDGYSTRLNMGYYDAFVPIGSEEKPFGGVFDGSGLILDNLNVSGSGVSDIGVFGFVTDEAEIKDLYIDNLSIDVSGAVANAHAAHPHACVGYIAGHIEDASCVTETYVNNCKIVGSSVLTKNDWGYFGKCDNALTVQAFIDKANGQGHDNDWGGTFDSRDTNNWIYSQYQTTVTGQGGKIYEYSTMQSGSDGTEQFNTKSFSDFNLKFATAYKTGVYGSSGNYTSYNYYMNPDSFNEPEDGLAVRNATQPSMVYQLKDSCYIPLKMNDAKNATASDNTGYLVGGSHGSASSILGSPKLSSYYYSSIGNSLQATAWTVGTAVANKTLGYTDSNLEVLTYGKINGNSGWYRISDTHNENNSVINGNLSGYSKHDYADFGFGKYKDSRDHFQTMCESSNRMHGIHFESVEVSTSNKITAPTAKVNGSVYSNYELLKGSIEFNLEHNGFINFFAGTYYTQTKYFNFFSLYKVERNGGSITSAKRIKEIYLNTDSSPKYVYKYTDNSYSEGTAGQLVFDVTSTLESDAPVNNALYYFEVPVNEGEYAMGMVPGQASSYTGAYMMYLDIGANAGEGTGQASVDDFGSVEYRSSPDTAANSILILTYSQGTGENLEISVAYDDTRKRYDIVCHGDTMEITVTILSTDYTVYFNSIALPNEIGSYPNTPAT